MSAAINGGLLTDAKRYPFPNAIPRADSSGHLFFLRSDTVYGIISPIEPPAPPSTAQVVWNNPSGSKLQWWTGNRWITIA